MAKQSHNTKSAGRSQPAAPAVRRKPNEPAELHGHPLDDRVSLPAGLQVSEQVYAIRFLGDQLAPEHKSGDAAFVDPLADLISGMLALLVIDGKREGIYRVAVAPMMPSKPHKRFSASSEIQPAALLETLDGKMGRWVQVKENVDLHPIVGWAA